MMPKEPPLSGLKEPPMSRRTKRIVLIGVVVVAFLAVTVIGVEVQSPTLWFLGLLVAFTILVIGSGPWILGS